MSESPSGREGRGSRRVIRGPWAGPDPAPQGRWRGPLPLILVALAAVIGTQNLVPPREALLRLTAGHRSLTGPVLARLLPSGSEPAFESLLLGLDRLLAAALLLLLLGWGLRRCGLGRREWVGGLLVSLGSLLFTLALCVLLARLLSSEAPWWGGMSRPLLGAAGLWSAGFAYELLLRGVLQTVLVELLIRLLGNRRRALAVTLGILLAALWGTLLLASPLAEQGFEGWELAGLLAHHGLLLGLVLGGIYARTGNLVLAGGLHGSYELLARFHPPGWPPTLASTLLLLVALLGVTALLSRDLLDSRAS